MKFLILSVFKTKYPQNLKDYIQFIPQVLKIKG